MRLIAISIGTSGGVCAPPILAVLVAIGARTLDTSPLVRQDNAAKCITVEFNFRRTAKMTIVFSFFSLFFLSTPDYSKFLNRYIR